METAASFEVRLAPLPYSTSHPDGGEVTAKRKGVVARRGLKEAWSKDATRWIKTGYEAYGAGRVGK